MNAKDVQEGLRELILATKEYDSEDMLDSEFIERVSEVASYEERMILTHDKGIVLNFADGSEFQITIIQSRRSDME